MAENTIKTLPAIRLLSDENGKSYFEEGKIKTHTKISASEFWFANEVESWEVNKHTAPRKQFVVTLSGELIFKVSDGSTFLIKPGVILLAEDLTGEGHSWEMAQGFENWERIYIPINEDDFSFYLKDGD